MEIEGNKICALYAQVDSSVSGRGSSLLQHAENEIGAAGFESVVLEASLDAEGFYEQRGYQQLVGGCRSDVVPMIKRLEWSPSPQ